MAILPLTRNASRTKRKRRRIKKGEREERKVPFSLSYLHPRLYLPIAHLTADWLTVDTGKEMKMKRERGKGRKKRKEKGRISGCDLFHSGLTSLPQLAELEDKGQRGGKKERKKKEEELSFPHD